MSEPEGLAIFYDFIFTTYPLDKINILKYR